MPQAPRVWLTCPDDLGIMWRSSSPSCPWACGQVAGTEEPVWVVWVFFAGNLAVSGKRAEQVARGEALEPSDQQHRQGCAPVCVPLQAPPTVPTPLPPGHCPYRYSRKNPLFIVDLMLDTSGCTTARHWSSLRLLCSPSLTRASWPPTQCPSWRRYSGYSCLGAAINIPIL